MTLFLEVTTAVKISRAKPQSLAARWRVQVFPYVFGIASFYVASVKSDVFFFRPQHDEQLITLVHAPKKKMLRMDQILEIDVFGQNVFMIIS